MKLVSIDRSGFPAAAILSQSGDHILPISAAPGGYGSAIPVSMNDLLEDWGFWKEKLKETSAQAQGVEWLPVESVQLISPVPTPRTLTCIGLNYRDHATETGAAIPEEPVVFAKHTSCVVGPDAQIVLPDSSDQVDFEAELAVVMGSEVHDVSPREAIDAVAGYTVFNDVSARDWQARTSQWMLSKSFPTFGPMGPTLVTADEFGDGSGKRIRLAVNGETLQDSSTDELIFSIGEIVSHLSKVWPIRPGDVIATGTPAGVGFTRTPPVFLRENDIVEIEIEGIGVLRNQVVAPRTVTQGTK